MTSCVLVGYGGDESPAGASQRRAAASDGSTARTDGDGGSSARTDGEAGSPAQPSLDGGALGCGANESCKPDCKSESCNVACAYAAICWTDCAPGAHCSIDCKHAGICDMNCREGARCEVDCLNARDCDYLACKEGASCVLYCGNNLLGCSLSCDGAAMTCPNNVHVCDAPCP